MKKTLIMLIMSAFLVVLCAFSYAQEGVISQIGEEPIQEIREPTLDNIRLDPRLMPDTIIKDDNTAEVIATDIQLRTDNFEALSNDRVNLYVEATETINELCFEFPVDTQYITIDEIKINVPLWFDTDLKTLETRTNNKICYNGINVQIDQIYFRPSYIYYKGMPDTIKYNITVDGLVLDPYLIGNLATSNQLVLSVPFKDNSSVVFAVLTSGLTSSNTRYNDTEYSVSYAGYSTNPTNTYDGSWSTADSLSTGSSNPVTQSSEYIFTYYKKTSDTGMVLQKKDGTSYTPSFSYLSVYPSNFGYTNISIPSSCFSFYTDNVKIRIVENVGQYAASIDYYCFGSEGYISLSSSSVYQEDSWSWWGGAGYVELNLYETAVYITNQSNFSAYTYPEVKTQYYNTNGLVYSNSFKFFGNQSDTLRNLSLYNDINITQFATARNVTFNDTGANFNTTGYIEINESIINLGNITWSMSFSQKQNNNDYLIFAKSNRTVFTYDYGIYSPLNNQYACSIVNTTGTEHRTNYYNLSNNTKIMFTCVYDSINNNLTSYINGVLYANKTIIGNLRNLETNYTIGAWNKGRANTGYGFNGTIYDFRLYNQVLTADEINIMYKGGNFTTNKLNETNSSMYFNGNEALRIQNNTLNGISAYSTSQWVKFDSSLYGRIHSAYEGYGLLTTRSVWNGIYMNYTILDNSWHNIITTYTPNTSTIYIDGVLTNLTTGQTSAFNSVSPFTIGSRNTFVQSYTGTISNFLMYNYVLGSSEIYRLSHGYSLNDVDDCTSYNNTLVNINVFNENNPGETLSSTFDVFLTYYFNNDTTQLYNFSHRYSSALNNFSICFANLQSNIVYDLYSQYTVDGGFTHRYYLYNQSYNNQTAFISVGNYNSQQNVSRLNLVVRDVQDYSPLLGVIGKLQRFYTQEGIWRNVQMDKSADYGLLIYNVREADTDYRIVFTDTKNNIYKTTQPLKFSCQYGICDLTYILDTKLTPIRPSLDITYFYNNISKILTVNWTDSNAVTSNFHVIARKDLYNGSIVVCNNNSNGIAGTLTCNLTNYNGTISVYTYSSASPETIKLSFIIDIIDQAKLLMSYISPRDGVFYSFGLALVAMTAGLFSPIAAIVLTLVSIYFASLMGLNILFSSATIIILCVIGLLIGNKVRQ